MKPRAQLLPSTRVISVALGLFSATLLLLLHMNPLVGEKLDELEAVTYDYRVQTRPAQPLNDDILLVGLTDFDLDSLSEPIDTREVHWLLLRTLKNLGVDSVLFDFVFVSDRQRDIDLGLEVQQVRTLLPYHFYINQQYPRLEMMERRKEAIDETWFIPYSPEMGGEFGPGHEALEIKLPVPWLIESAANLGGLGHINVVPDTDGAVRRIPLLIRYQHSELGDCLYPSISLRYVLSRLGLTMNDLSIRFGEAIEFTHGDPPITTRIPINEHGELLINFREAESFTTRGLSAGAVLNIGRQLDDWISLPLDQRPPLTEFEVEGIRVSRDLFEDALVLVGEVAVASTDIRATAIDRALPMITVHANVINSLLNRDFITETPPRLAVAITLAIGLLAGVLFGRLGYIRSFITGGFMTLGYIALGWLMFVLWSVWIPIVLPMLTLGLGAFLILLYHLVIEDKRRSFIKSAFEAYTSPEVVAEILQNIDDPALWGAKRRVTSLFVDIRGFTTLTEKTPPEMIVEILNEYYQVAVEAIRRHGGIPNKFIGDEIMALFNAPRAIENAEEAACRAAIDIQLSVARLNAEKLRPELGREITCGVGVNTGEVIVGIVGKEKIEYTALGDDVNIASRLQGRARPWQVLIGQSTYEALQRGPADILKAQVTEVRQIPEIVLKGLTRKFDVYELCYERGQNA